MQGAFSTIKSCLSRLLMIVASTIFFGALAEGVARLVLNQPTHITISAQPRTEQTGTKAPPRAAALFPHHSEGMYVLTPSGWRLRPNMRAAIRNHPFNGAATVVHTNSLGFRNPELTEKKGRRVLFLGDSVTLSAHLAEEDTFVRRVQSLAEKQGLALETVNGGADAIGLKDYFEILKENYERVRPDIVVVDFFLNDATLCCGIRITPLPDWLHWSWFAYYINHSLHMQGWRGLPGRSRLESPILAEWRSETERRFKSRPALPQLDLDKEMQQAVLANFKNWGNAWSSLAWQPIESSLKDIIDFCRERELVLAVVIFPVRQQVELNPAFDYPQKRLSNICARHNVPALDLLPPLAAAWKENSGETRLFADDIHPTAEGSRLIAGHISHFLMAFLTH